MCDRTFLLLHNESAIMLRHYVSLWSLQQKTLIEPVHTTSFGVVMVNMQYVFKIKSHRKKVVL